MANRDGTKGPNIWTYMNGHYISEVSTWEGNGRPDPLTGESTTVQLQSFGMGDSRFFTAAVPSGARIKLFND